MSITFEEVSAEIQREPQREDSGETAARKPSPADDLHEQLERELRLMAERQARLQAD